MKCKFRKDHSEEMGALIAVAVVGAIATHHIAKAGAKLIANAISGIKVSSPESVTRNIVFQAVKQAADVYEYSKAIAESLTETSKRIPHVHHIVPAGKFSNRSPSTVNKINQMHAKLNRVGINRYFDPMNLMLVSAQTHARLHTDAYIDHVHSYIMSAGDSKQEVYGAMFYLRIEIAAQDLFASGF